MKIINSQLLIGRENGIEFTYKPIIYKDVPQEFKSLEQKIIIKMKSLEFKKDR